MQGQLRKSPLVVEINTTCAHCGSPMEIEHYNCPTVRDGLRAMQFTFAALESVRNGSAWVPLER